MGVEGIGSLPVGKGNVPDQDPQIFSGWRDGIKDTPLASISLTLCSLTMQDTTHNDSSSTSSTISTASTADATETAPSTPTNHPSEVGTIVDELAHATINTNDEAPTETAIREATPQTPGWSDTFPSDDPAIDIAVQEAVANSMAINGNPEDLTGPLAQLALAASIQQGAALFGTTGHVADWAMDATMAAQADAIADVEMEDGQPTPMAAINHNPPNGQQAAFDEPAPAYHNCINCNHEGQGGMEYVQVANPHCHLHGNNTRLGGGNVQGRGRGRGGYYRGGGRGEGRGRGHNGGRGGGGRGRGRGQQRETELERERERARFRQTRREHHEANLRVEQLERENDEQRRMLTEMQRSTLFTNESLVSNNRALTDFSAYLAGMNHNDDRGEGSSNGHRRRDVHAAPDPQADGRRRGNRGSRGRKDRRNDNDYIFYEY